MGRFVALIPLAALLVSCVIVAEDDGTCTTADNRCSDPWYLNYCVDATMYGTDCNQSCTSDPEVYGATCGGTPAVAGECDAAGGVCVCWCEEAFDSCQSGAELIRYTRAGVTYEVDCKTYCGGTCDGSSHACACP